MMMGSDLQSRLKVYRLSSDEYELMKRLLGREPLEIEWPLFSALWSEHCSYKSSRVHLRKFSYRNQNTPALDGENAGVVDLGYGEKIAFKMESHNHPSFIEPVQGSATGVGGILRDIFTMGARPIASADYLCFGEVNASRMKYLMNGVAKGISSYGNCVGVPTVTGQCNFNARYNKNILVNAMNVGYFAPEQPMALSNAQGPGNYVVYVGAKTGRDGVHGASMASASFDDDTEAKKPNVQIGDPFYEKLLIEACLEVLKENLVVSMQDMGAAGLTSSSFEMASKGQVGLKIDLKKVPLRDTSMTAEDILLSESQERMLLICLPQNFERLQKVFKKWNLDSVVLGEVRKERKITLFWGPEKLTEIDPDLIVDKAPLYNRPYQKWSFPNRKESLSAVNINAKKIVDDFLNSYRLNRHHWIHSQFDQRVGARTAKACESSVAFVRLDHSGRGLGVAVGCRPELMQMDADIGARDAVFYPALQMALKGAQTLAITDCLNFGNPQKSEIMSEFVASVEAIAQTSRELEAPVISGNVSFYNETLEENIISTPATGLVAIREDVEDITADQFSRAYENIIHVHLDWVKSYMSTQPKKDFIQNPNVRVADFIQKCSALESFLKENDLTISASKCIGLGGVGICCLKMLGGQIGFDLSHDMRGVDLAELFADQLYGFILVTPGESQLFMNKLNDFFAGFNTNIKKIGETADRTIKFTDQIEFDFSEITRRLGAQEVG